MRDAPAYFEVFISKTAKGEPIAHQIFVNELVIHVIQELEQSTAKLREESGLSELFLTRNKGICVPSTLNWSKNRLRTFIRRCNICNADGELYGMYDFIITYNGGNMATLRAEVGNVDTACPSVDTASCGHRCWAALPMAAVSSAVMSTG